MKYIFFAILLIAITNCSPYASKYHASEQLTDIRSNIKESKLPSSCLGLNRLIEEQWFYDNKRGYYIYDAFFMNTIEKEYQNCFTKLTLKEVQQILGKPSYEHENYLCYFVDMPCKDYDACFALSVSAKNSKVTSIGYGGCNRKIH